MFKQKTLSDEITDYIKKNLKKGYTKESLKWALVNQGYSKIEVIKAMQRAEEQLASEAPILRTKPEIQHTIEPITDEPRKGFWKNLFR